ncbi:hypothetical protein SC029_11380 [Legionella pneumophila serogroup 1]
MDIIKLSKLGEGNTLEYKRNTDKLDSILKSVSAFANTAGGIIQGNRAKNRLTLGSEQGSDCPILLYCA